MEKTVLQVDGMSCEHCVTAITNAVGALAGVKSVQVNLDLDEVTVEHDPNKSPRDKIAATIKDQGYDVAR